MYNCNSGKPENQEFTIKNTAGNLYDIQTTKQKYLQPGGNGYVKVTTKKNQQWVVAKVHAHPSPIPVASLADALKVYTYDFLPNSSLAQLEAQWSNYAPRVMDSMRLVCSTDLDAEKIRQHLVSRVPVYFGKAATKHFDYKKYEDLTGRTTDSNHMARLDIDARMRYGVLGWTPIIGNSEFSPVTDAWVLHTWGINTSDADVDKKYVFQGVNLDIGKYFELQNSLVDIIKYSALEVVRASGKRGVSVRVGGLGLGDWAKGLNEEYLEMVRTKFLDKLQAIHEAHTNLEFRFVDYPNGRILGCTDGAWKVVEHNEDPFGDNAARSHTSVVSRVPENFAYMVVNAWDNGSWIGNGGALDNTMDGWVVAGGSDHFHVSDLTEKPLGANFLNLSYFHNLIFQPHLLDKSTWVTFDGSATLSMYSYNVRMDNNESNLMKIEKDVRQFCEKSEYDVIALQEVPHTSAIRLANQITYNYSFAVAHGVHESVVLLVRKHLDARFHVIDSVAITTIGQNTNVKIQKYEHGRPFVFAHLPSPSPNSGSICVGTAHFWSVFDELNGNYTSLQEKLHAVGFSDKYMTDMYPSCTHRVIIGDTNMMEDDDKMKQHEQNGLKSRKLWDLGARTGVKTWDKVKNPTQIHYNESHRPDRVLTSWQARGELTVHEKNTNSDHFPISCRLYL